METNDIMIRVQSTPNPNAWKFILNQAVLNEGKLTYTSIQEAEFSPLAKHLFDLPGIRQVHFFQNVITVTHAFDSDPEEIQKNVCSVIQSRWVLHNPNMTTFDEKKIRRSNLPPEVQAIEEILDRTIRPGLQGDGGDIEVVRYEVPKLYVSYQGACGTCPSSTSGTLMAIEGILKDEFSSEIEVIPI